MQSILIKVAKDTRLISFAGSLFYLFIVNLFIGLKFENLFIVFGYNLLIWITPNTRKFILAFTVFVIFGVLYDFLKVFPNYLFNDIDIKGIYSLEKSLFGFNFQGIKITPNEFFSLNQNAALDIISGLFYINWIPVPLAFAVFLYLSNKRQYLHFALTFLLVNLIGFAGYYLHPAAPPWYVSLHGFIQDTAIHGNAAGFTRFDQYIGLQLFGSIYNRNSNVFAALPSLHCAYPVVVMAYGIKNKLGKVNWLFVVFMLGIWFASVYSGHHYVIDVILGVVTALLGIFVFDKILMKTTLFKSFVFKYLALIR